MEEDRRKILRREIWHYKEENIFFRNDDIHRYQAKQVNVFIGKQNESHEQPGV